MTKSQVDRPRGQALSHVLLSLFLVIAACGPQAGPDEKSAATVARSPMIAQAHHYDASPPLMLMPPVPRPTRLIEHEVKRLPQRFNGPHPLAADPVHQSSLSSILAVPSTTLNFDGVGNGFSGPAGTFTVNSAPPDTNGDVGPNHYVQIVNTDFAVFNKSGTALYGPVPINTLWSGFGGGCQTNNDGDPVAIYDPIADRWVISQFSVTTTPYLQCIAVSQTPDPTGAYYRYSFQYADFPDYPKMGVWPDAYYETFNLFAGGTTFSGGEVCAYDRARMLTGAAATQQCFNVGTSFGGLLPSDLDGARQPPSGSPNYVLGLGPNVTDTNIEIWKFHVDWSNTANTTLTGPTAIAVAQYTEACSGGTCIPQSGTSQQLDSLADRLMFRLAYRNFGDHEALVANHSVTAGSSTGVRWYELRLDASHNASLFQQGTYAPDSNYRWMGSLAMDSSGNMAMGFSVSSGSVHPEIHYTGRLAGDAAGTMTQGEGTIINGPGSQTGSNLSRWGDYSMMAVDPADDCTFWYTTEYIPSNGAFNWKTRIGSFKFPGCGAPANDFSIGASPTSLSIQQGNSGTSTISTAVTTGSAGTVSLTASVSPAGPTASLNPTSVTAGGSSTLTVSVGATVAPGTYTVTVTGTEGSATHSTTVSVTVTAAPSDFSISASPASVSIQQGGSGTSTIATAVTSGTAGTVSLSASVSPAGPTASLNPTSVTAGSSSTLTVSVGASVATGTYTVTVTGVEGSATHSATVTVTVTTPPPNDFSISASPASLSIQQGASGTSTISTAVTSGTAGTVSLSASVSPAGPTASLNPTSVTAGGSSTLTVSVGASVATGSYTVTVTGTEGSASHATTVSVTVTSVPIGGITNGGFETGTFSGWTTSGQTAIVTTSHSGSYAAQVGSTSPSNDSSITQTFTVPGNSNQLSFWYQVHCPDTLTYDWATATLKDNTAGTSTTPLAPVCSNTGSWVQVTAAVTAGHSYTLTLSNHDDNYPGDPTYTWYDDVTLNTLGPSDFTIAVSPTSTSIAQGTSGTVAVNVGAVNATESVSLSATGLPSGVTASFNPASVTSGGSSTLTLTVASSAAQGTSTITVTGTAASGGPHSATLSLTVTTPPTGGIVNGGFEAGNLSGWTPSGTTSVVSSGAHSGTYAAQIGGTSPTNGDSKIVQTFTVPAGKSRLTVWYKVVCPDTVTYDWATVTLRNNSSGTTATLLNRTCTNNGTWQSVSATVTAGTSYTLTLLSHDDNYPGDPTYTLYDDVTLQ